MNPELSLIVSVPQLPVFQPALAPAALAQIEAALSACALIGKVTNRAENDTAVTAMKSLKSLSLSLERERKALKEPYIEAGRAIDRVVAKARKELDHRNGEIECLVKDFILLEQQRIREEQEAQERELARIEDEKQAALAKIAAEAAEAERKAREAAEAERLRIQAEREAAEKLAREATNKKQREAAEAARIEAERWSEAARIKAERRSEAAAKIAADQAARITESADAQTALESKPIEITRTAGQTVRKQWVVKQINDLQLLRARPDLARKIEWDMVAIKEILSAGGKLPGVTAMEDLRVTTRTNGRQAVIDV